MNVNTFLKYVSVRFHQGASYGILNSERAAIGLVSATDLRDNSDISRFFRGAYKMRPTKPKYNTIWSTDRLLEWAEKLEPLVSLSLKDTTFKLISLLALATAQRVQTLSLIKISNIVTTKDNVTIRITDQIKTSRVGTPQAFFIIPFFNIKKSACVARVLLHYMKITKELRGDIDNLFITF